MQIPETVDRVVWFHVRTDYEGNFKQVDCCFEGSPPLLSKGDRCFGPYMLWVNIPPGTVAEIKQAFDGPPVEADARMLQATKAAVAGD
jgi:hypothetical protein